MKNVSGVRGQKTAVRWQMSEDRKQFNSLTRHLTPETEFSSLRSQLEYWNNGMVGIEDQNEYNDIDLLAIVVYFLGQK